MRHHRLGLLALILSIGSHVACSASDGSDLSSDDDGGVGAAGSGGDDGIGGGFAASGGSTGTGSTICNSGPDEDQDGDGFTFNQGDCNDCDPNVNPDAVEVLTPTEGGAEPADENCNNEIDEAPVTCDAGLALADGDAMNAARAIDICQVAGQETVWGVVSAAYVRANGSPASNGPSHGLLADFGNATPQLGDAMLGLSSGFARDIGDPGACTDSQSCEHNGPGVAPPGFPQDVPGCDGASDINDDIGLELELRAPSNAKGYSFDFAFTSFEFPEWVCTSYNDQFIALVDPPPMGSINGNISFDSQTNPVSVNIALFDHCDPADIGQFASLCFSGCPAPPNPYCPLGQSFMDGSGFNEWGDSGSTGWLVTTAPVTPNETFKIRFAIWDTGDSFLDSTALVDNFQWTAEPGTVGTEPIPNPK